VVSRGSIQGQYVLRRAKPLWRGKFSLNNNHTADEVCFAQKFTANHEAIFSRHISAIEMTVRVTSIAEISGCVNPWFEKFAWRKVKAILN
jgi:hypothetical protein